VVQDRPRLNFALYSANLGGLRQNEPIFHERDSEWRISFSAEALCPRRSGILISSKSTIKSSKIGRESEVEACTARICNKLHCISGKTSVAARARNNHEQKHKPVGRKIQDRVFPEDPLREVDNGDRLDAEIGEPLIQAAYPCSGYGACWLSGDLPRRTLHQFRKSFYCHESPLRFITRQSLPHIR
jgi:hypothetical protein